MREHKYVIVRTFINSIADCYAFSTPEYNKGNVLPKLIGGLKIADEIILKPHNGGVLEVELITVRTNGKNEYLTNERVYFDRGLVSAIEIFVEYDECRRQVKRQEDDEVAKLQSENAKLRKVVEDFYYPRQALAELDKEG